MQHFASASYKGSPAYTAMHSLFYEFFTNLECEDQDQITFHRLILQEHENTFPAIAVGTPNDDLPPAAPALATVATATHATDAAALPAPATTTIATAQCQAM